MYKALENRYEQTKIRHAGNSGLMLPAISLGLWRHLWQQCPTKQAPRCDSSCI